MNPAQKVINLGQSLWYDNISRELIADGTLKDLTENLGVRGVTSNPTIFDKAISSGSTYDAQISSLKKDGLASEAIFEEIAVQDIAAACDVLKPIFDKSKGTDGFVSLEVSPKLAHDTEGSIEEAKRLHKKVGKENLMIKIPGTPEGIPAIKALLEEGISVNVTLLFSVDNYVAVAKAYCEALKNRAAKDLPIDSIRSVASFFVSRVDTLVDSKLAAIIEGAGDNNEKKEQASSLLGQFGIANSKLAYREFEKIFYGDEFKPLAEKGAAVQRPLWASTSTKNPEYRDVMYIEELIGKDTVNTVPDPTLRAFADHGEVRDSVKEDIEKAAAIPSALEELGINLGEVFSELQRDGVEKFVASFDALHETISKN